jgi:hypothetical protein
MNLLAGINKRYDIMVASKTEQDFYLNVYQYYDYIFTNPFLYNLYTEGDKAYRMKADVIWSSSDRSIPENVKHQSQLTHKMEQVDMYCNGCCLEGRLYRPLKDYYETGEPDMLQDPFAVAIVKGIDYAAEVCSKRPYAGSKKEIKKGFNNWFKNQRDGYQQELTTFHIQFIRQIEEIEDDDSAPSSNEIYFDIENSLLILGGKTVRIKRKTQPPVEHYVLEYIFENEGVGEKAYFSEILSEKFDQDKGDWRKIHKACQRLEDKIRKESGLSNVLIYNTGIAGAVSISALD